MQTTDKAYAVARAQYSDVGVDTDKALGDLKAFSISIHCWQADDVGGFERPGATLNGGGIQATGNHPGKARTIQEARADYERVLSLVPGSHRLNLHAIYGEFPTFTDRDGITPDHFESWVQWARELNLPLDFNCSCFSHPKSASGFTLSHPDAAIRKFWIEHVRRCREIASYLGRRQGEICIHNVWVPDGSKDMLIDRYGYRQRLLESLDECFETAYSANEMKDALESKLFGIGAEWFTVGSHEFYMPYALTRNKVLCFDMGHFHPTESVADKISAYLQYADELLVHVSRPVRWDSDHVVLRDDATRELTQEIVRRRHNKKIHMALDFFDASINRVGAYILGVRSTQQALLEALLLPERNLIEHERAGENFQRLALLESAKLLPLGAVWNFFCEQNGVPTEGAWVAEVQRYEHDVLAHR